MSGPLQGLRILEFSGIGPAPFAAMTLSDAGADVIRIDRPIEGGGVTSSVARGRARNVMNRGRRSVVLDLKKSEAAAFLLELVGASDGLIEGFRPGVMERLGLGPDACFESNPQLVYGRVTGWGREGIYANAAGHDIDYLAISGTLNAIGPRGQAPVPPLNLLGDFGGGGLLLAFGMTSALVERAASGLGQVVDVAMVDGAAYLTTYIHGMRALGLWTDERGSNLLDGGAPFYRVYETRDRKYVAVGAVEDRFYFELLELLGLEDEDLPDRHDRNAWEDLSGEFARVFASRTRDEWMAVFDATDACVAPVLSLEESAEHQHVKERGTFVTVDNVRQPAPTPRFSRTPSSIQRGTPEPGEGGKAALVGWGVEPSRVQALCESGVITAF